MVVNQGVLFCACGCDSWCVILSQWLQIMESYDEPVVVYHDVLYMSQWVRIMLCYAEPVVVNHGEL